MFNDNVDEVKFGILVKVKYFIVVSGSETVVTISIDILTYNQAVALIINFGKKKLLGYLEMNYALN